MRAAEFLRKVQQYGRKNGITVQFVPAKGKGSHGRLYYGAAFTTLKDLRKEIGKGLLHGMCRDLGLDPDEL